MSVQFGIFDSDEEKASKLKKHDESQLSLPVDPLQEKLDHGDPTLTERELEILQIVLAGHSIPDISMKIFLSPFGVKWRLSNIYRKFQVKNRLQLIKKASKEGLQFLSENGIKHSFVNRINMRAHE